MANKKISALDAVTTPASDDVLPIVNASETKKINLGQLQNFMSVACRLATTANIDLATGGLMDVDGITTAAGNRILVWQQADAKENGIYIAAESSWTRAANFSNARNMVSGMLIPTLEGTSYSNTIFQHTTGGAITPGTTAIAFAKVTASSAWGEISGNITDQTDLVNKINTDIQTAVDALKGSVPAEGDTLKKLHDLLIAGGTVTVVDNLTGTSSTQALSAKQGAVLKGLIDTINTLLTSDDTSLDELQEIVTELKVVRATLDGMDEGGEIVALLDAAIGNTAWRVPGTYTAAISGNVTLDLSQGDVFQLTLTNHVTSFDFTNEVPGKSYVFYFMQDTTRKNLLWATGRYRFSFGNAPQLTDPTQNGSDPVASVDIITALCPFAGRLDLVSSPNYVAN